MPIRSALQILQVEGFVTYSPRQGASVRQLDANYVRQLYDVRVALTAMLLPSVVRHISMAHLEDAQMFLEEFRAHVKARRLAEAMRSNSSFHRTIYAVAGNQPAIEVLERTWMILDALRARVGFGEGRLEQSDEGHHRLLNALKERDAATAIAIATKYAESACADLSVRLEEDRTAPKN
jgi:DNA-binding GntR family transcriptional regulator